MAFVGDVNGPNMTRTQARRLIGNVARGHVQAPRAMARTTRILSATAAVECESCGNSTTNGMIVGREWLCLACAHKASD